ncbi:hypothetical protein HDU80_001642 [Chytriomyces hyalinus]|nr:hypothetical protein HDU80_001642 [Chytriomyces hyalinus]
MTHPSLNQTAASHTPMHTSTTASTSKIPKSSLSTFSNTPEQQQQQQQQYTSQPTLPPPNVSGRLLARDPSAPHPSLLEAPSVLETPSQAASTDPINSNNIINNNTNNSKAYPDLSLNNSESPLVDANGHLRPTHEREAVFDQLEARVQMLKRKCKDIVKCAKSLQKACLANATFASSSINTSSSASMNNSSSASSYAGSVTGGGPDESNGDTPFTSAASLTRMPGINFGTASGSGVKKRSNGGGLEVSHVELKDRLRDELIKLVRESREMRNSILADTMDKKSAVSEARPNANSIGVHHELSDVALFS